jgi:hypothetical protein
MISANNADARTMEQLAFQQFTIKPGRKTKDVHRQLCFADLLSADMDICF